MKKLVFIALDAEEYKYCIEDKYKDFDVDYISLKWRYNSIEDWISLARDKIKQDVDLLVGFSVGGIISLLVVKDIKPKKMEIISPSPFFNEILPSYSKTMINVAGKKRIKEIKSLNLTLFRKHCKTTVYIGSEELEIMKRASHLISKQLKCSLVVLEGKDHRNILKIN